MSLHDAVIKHDIMWPHHLALAVSAILGYWCEVNHCRLLNEDLIESFQFPVSFPINFVCGKPRRKVTNCIVWMRLYGQNSKLVVEHSDQNHMTEWLCDTWNFENCSWLSLVWCCSKFEWSVNKSSLNEDRVDKNWCFF